MQPVWLHSLLIDGYGDIAHINIINSTSPRKHSHGGEEMQTQQIYIALHHNPSKICRTWAMSAVTMELLMDVSRKIHWSLVTAAKLWLLRRLSMAIISGNSFSLLNAPTSMDYKYLLINRQYLILHAFS